MANVAQIMKTAKARMRERHAQTPIRGDNPSSKAAQLGYISGYLDAAMPSDKTLEKIAGKTKIPADIIKAAVFKKEALGLMGALGLASIPMFGLPALRGLSKGLDRGIERVTGRAFGVDDKGSKTDMGSIGGIPSSEMRMYNKMITQQALKNHQMRRLLDQIRRANSPLSSSPLYGAGR